MQTFDLIAHLKRQRAFSRSTFGPGIRTAGVSDHIKRELIEIAADPTDMIEWVDVVLLALDGLWRCAEASNTPIEVAVGAIEAKQSKNERRTWPDWRTADPDKAIEHVDLTRATPNATTVAAFTELERPDGPPPCPKPRVPRRPCFWPQCDCEHLIGGPGKC